MERLRHELDIICRMGFASYFLIVWDFVRFARDNGIPTMITDWRMTNLLASRFWPRRGFRETFLRLYRSIP